MQDENQREQAERARFQFLGITFAVIGIGLATFFLANPYFERALLDQTTGRATLFRTTLEQTLDRFHHLPLVLRDDPLIVGAFEGTRLEATNARLESIAQGAGIEAIYLMDPNGLTIAASNHGEAQSFLGQNYGFRPYFQDAMRGRHGTFFAIGATTRRPGYFIADGVRDASGQAIGVVAVKIDLAPLVRSWANTGETVFVSNADGVVFLSSDDRLRYRTLRAIAPERLSEIADERQFADEPLTPLDWALAEANQVRLEGTIFQHVAFGIGDHGWTLHFLSDLDQVLERTWLVVIVVVLAMAGPAVLVLTFQSERLRRALTSSQRDRAALVDAYDALTRTQAELQRSSKLAALGQLSASVTHELGQPISALRNYITAAELTDGKNGLIEPVSRLVARMEAITRQLRFFATPSSEGFQKIDLREAVIEALALVEHDLEATGAQLETDLIPADVIGDRLRLEQVVVNLLRNAIAAVADAERREIKLFISHTTDTIALKIRDSGPGLGGRTMAQLAEPFHSTRDSGTGMGLGLAISSEIVRDHKGQLMADDLPGGGAQFTVHLPKAEAGNG